MRLCASVVCVLLVAGLAGCFGGSPEPGGLGASDPGFPAGQHPYPDGNEWPLGLEGPFDLMGVEHVRVPSHDGVELDGWILRPALPDGVLAPLVLWSAPYFGQCTLDAQCNYATGDDPALRDASSASEAVPIDFLLEHGYAVAVFNVRGTGNSGGCLDWHGLNEQRDQAELVEWLAAQPWSNGRIAMQGLSYHGTTPWEAAIQNPEPLKTIVVAGPAVDPYTWSHSPQGATFRGRGGYGWDFPWRVTLSPPIQGPVEHWTVDHAPVVPDRICPAVARAVADDYAGVAADRRDEAFWGERRLIDRFPDVEAAVFITHGFQDRNNEQQALWVWQSLAKAPKRMLEGQWGHEMPQWNSDHPEWRLHDWNQTLLAWYDFWLKGIGDAPPGEGTVDYQDSVGIWHQSTAWPPGEAREEVLHLADGERLSSEAGSGSAAFRSAPDVEDADGDVDGNPPWQTAFCPGAAETLLGRGERLAAAYVSDPAQEDLLIAGNPFAFLRLSSDLPGGQVAIHVYGMALDAGCEGGFERWVSGVADLRFHEGNFVGRDFPTNTPTNVRVDFNNLAEVLLKGHRVAVVVSYGGEGLSPPTSYGDPVPTFGLQPRIAVHHDGDAQASHVVLPFVEGSLGGSAPTAHYPPRPFLPEMG